MYTNLVRCPHSVVGTCGPSIFHARFQGEGGLLLAEACNSFLPWIAFPILENSSRLCENADCALFLA